MQSPTPRHLPTPTRPIHHAPAPTDFVRLATHHPGLLPYLAGSRVDFNLPGSASEVVTAMIRVDYGVAGWRGVPPGYLVPSVTRSVNYLNKIKDLMKELDRDEGDDGNASGGMSVKESMRVGSLGLVGNGRWNVSGNVSGNENGRNEGSSFGEESMKVRVESLGLVGNVSGNGSGNGNEKKEGPIFGEESMQVRVESLDFAGNEKSREGDVAGLMHVRDEDRVASTDFVVNPPARDGGLRVGEFKRMHQGVMMQSSDVLGKLDAQSSSFHAVRRGDDEKQNGDTDDAYNKRFKPSFASLMPSSIRQIKGLDVGVGASCIFPVLGCAMHKDWKFVGLEVDELARQWAFENSDTFRDRVEIRSCAPGPTPRIKDALSMLEEFDFCMCNPPFFDKFSEETSRFAGTATEKSCKNGEVGFVIGLIEESIALKSRISWFSSMIGKKSSLQSILNRLHVAQVDAIRVFKLDQGQKFRWVVAWSFLQKLHGGVIGKALEIQNLEYGETIESRITQALGEVRNYNTEAGVCRMHNYFFRLRVVVISAKKPCIVRVDSLDHKGKECASKAKGARDRIEQVLRRSRKWKKRQQQQQRGGFGDCEMQVDESIM